MDIEYALWRKIKNEVIFQIKQFLHNESGDTAPHGRDQDKLLLELMIEY